MILNAEFRMTLKSAVVAYFTALIQYSCGKTDENLDHIAVSSPRLEPATSRIQECTSVLYR